MIDKQHFEEKIDDILLEWSFRIPDGIPSLQDVQHVQFLQEILTSRGFSNEQVGVLLAEISKDEKAVVARRVEIILKKMSNIKSLAELDVQYPPRASTITKQGASFLVKSTIELNGISNQNRDSAFEAILLYLKGQGYHAKHVMSRDVSSSAGYIEVKIDKTLMLWITLKGMQKLVSGEVSDTDVKEGLVSVLYQMKELNPVDISTLPLLISRINDKQNFLGESATTIEKIKSFLLANVANKNVIKLINQTMSQARAIHTQYPGWIVDRNIIFSTIRTAANKASKYPADKWCPADLYIINPKIAGQIPKQMRLVNNADTPADQIQLLNDLFVNDWGDTDKPIVGISLKLAQAQGGKAKDFLKRFDSSPKEYNLSPEELSSSAPIIKSKIQDARSKLYDILQQSEVSIDYDVPSHAPDLSLDKLLLKLGSIKLFTFLLSQRVSSGNVDDILVSTIGYGLSLSGINPTFFKLVGSKSLDAAIQPTKFPAGGVVTLYPTGPDKRNADIACSDRNTNTGISFDMVIQKGEEICDVRLTARPNGMKQVTLEIERIKCRVQEQ